MSFLLTPPPPRRADYASIKSCSSTFRPRVRASIGGVTRRKRGPGRRAYTGAQILLGSSRSILQLLETERQKGIARPSAERGVSGVHEEHPPDHDGAWTNHRGTFGRHA